MRVKDKICGVANTFAGSIKSLNLPDAVKLSCNLLEEDLDRVIVAVRCIKRCDEAGEDLVQMFTDVRRRRRS